MPHHARPPACDQCRTTFDAKFIHTLRRAAHSPAAVLQHAGRVAPHVEHMRAHPHSHPAAGPRPALRQIKQTAGRPGQGRQTLGAATSNLPDSLVSRVSRPPRTSPAS